MKSVWWALCAATLAVSAWFALRGRTGHTVVVQSSSIASAVATARAPCPPRTLLDDGACVPLPKSSETSDVVPRLPSRPQEYAAYVLPASGDVLLGTWADLAPELGPELSGPAWLITATVDAPVEVVALAGQSVHLRERGPHWLVLESAPDSSKTSDPLIAVLGPLTVELGAQVGEVLAPGTRLGRTVAGGLGLAVRRLRPGEKVEQSLEKWGAQHQVWVDPRNVLPMRGSNADALTPPKPVGSVNPVGTASSEH